MTYDECFVPYPFMETERLFIRAVRKSDAEQLFELCRRPETSRYSLWSPHESMNDTKRFISMQHTLMRKRKCMFFVVEIKNTGRVIGTCSYASMDDYFKIAEIGYSLISDIWNNGYGTEVADALVGYAFERIGVQRVFARVLPENEASAAVLKKLGFYYEGRHKKEYYYDGRVSDVDVYALTDDEYGKVGNNYGIKTNCKF